jgi:carbonic anhydrase/acetyltransferase-like protein (isoleucine patch superfamily)
MIEFIVPELKEFFPLSPNPRKCRVLNEPLEEFLRRELAALPDGVRWRMDCIPDPEFVARLAGMRDFEVRDQAGEVVAAYGTPGTQVPFAGLVLRYPWDILVLNERLVAKLEKPEIAGEVSPAAHVEGVIRVGAGSRILPGVFIEGNVVIGKNCKIGPNCYLRGNTVIGDNCHVGQAVEIKNSVIGFKTAVGHLSYVGDSVLGDHVNFGAGTIIGNLRHDGKNHRSLVNGTLVDTGRRKFGAIVGDDVHTGIHTAIYPGRKLAAGTSTRPGDVVQLDLGND